MEDGMLWCTQHSTYIHTTRCQRKVQFSGHYVNTYLFDQDNCGSKATAIENVVLFTNVLTTRSHFLEIPHPDKLVHEQRSQRICCWEFWLNLSNLSWWSHCEISAHVLITIAIPACPWSCTLLTYATRCCVAAAVEWGMFSNRSSLFLIWIQVITVLAAGHVSRTKIIFLIRALIIACGVKGRSKVTTYIWHYVVFKRVFI